MAKKPVIKFTTNFERKLEDIERFLTGAETPQAYDALLDELLESVIPNLERFPGMGRPFMLRQPHSVETSNAFTALRAKLSALTPDPGALREYILKNYLILYVNSGNTIHLLSIRHHRQLSFDFESQWASSAAQSQKNQ